GGRRRSSNHVVRGRIEGKDPQALVAGSGVSRRIGADEVSGDRAARGAVEEKTAAAVARAVGLESVEDEALERAARARRRDVEGVGAAAGGGAVDDDEMHRVVP